MNREKENLEICTDKGIVEGVQMDGYAVFRGIPFAKPPVGELRWKAPQDMNAWEGVYKADNFARICPQRPAREPNPFYKEFYANPEYQREMNEDCLYLNIWVPSEAKREKLPVAIYIHGGGFGGGYSSEMEFDGEGFARRNVIFVSIAYRLGIFGFLAHPWLTAENERHISGNYGILDQIAALNWVYRNIEAFGGDRDNITVFGQSAGCMSTQVLISSGLTDGKIAKAIFQSGLSCEDELLAVPTLREEEEYGQKIVEVTGAKNLDELRKMDAETLMSAKDIFDQECWSKAEDGAGALRIVPNVDGYVLKENVRDAYRRGNFKKIPYMEGVVTEDLGTKEEDRKKRVPGMLLQECERWAEKQQETGGKPSYVYWFDRTLPGDNLPAWHSLELWYVMGTLDRAWRPWEKHDYELAEEVQNCWANFMRTGDPCGSNTGEWRPYTKEDPFVRKFE